MCWFFALGGISWAVQAQSGRSREWLTWGGDIERTGWNRGETTLSKQTVGRLALKWKTQIDKEVSIEIESGNSMLTTPLVAQGVSTPQGPKTVVYTLSASNTLAALDAATGAPIWRRTFDNTVEPRSAPNWICTNMSTATPVIDKAKGIDLHAGGRWTPAWRRSRQRRGEADAAAGVRDAVLAQLEPQPRRWRPVHDRRTRVRQRSRARRARASAGNDSRWRRAGAAG